VFLLYLLSFVGVCVMCLCGLSGVRVCSVYLVCFLCVVVWILFIEDVLFVCRSVLCSVC